MDKYSIDSDRCPFLDPKEGDWYRVEEVMDERNQKAKIIDGLTLLLNNAKKDVLMKDKQINELVNFIKAMSHDCHKVSGFEPLGKYIDTFLDKHDY